MSDGVATHVQPEPAPSSAPPPTLLEARRVRKTFTLGETKLDVLHGVDMEVRVGERLALMGPSGAGKSTLLHILGLLDRPTDGTVLFEGREAWALSATRRAKLRNQRIGFVFQFYHLLPEFTALENVMMPGLSQGLPRNDCRPRAEELLDTVGLSERLRHRPGQLSGGEQQRVAIARALYNSPSVVMADEPTGNLDEHTGEDIIDLLWSLNEKEGMTLVLVTHAEHLAERAHRWIHLHEGKAHCRK